MPAIIKSALILGLFVSGMLAGCSGPERNVGDGSCTLVIDNPDVPLTGYTVYAPDEKRNHPEANEPTFVYLAAGLEAVAIPGPPVVDAAGLYALESPAITLVGDSGLSADGYSVVVNPRLRYEVAIDDYEHEVHLARLELCQAGGNIQSNLVFAAAPSGEGIADIAITAHVDGTASTPTPIIPVEVR